MIQNRKPIIISISGYSLTKAEINILKRQKPWGVILFKRNRIIFLATILNSVVTSLFNGIPFG